VWTRFWPPFRRPRARAYETMPPTPAVSTGLYSPAREAYSRDRLFLRRPASVDGLFQAGYDRKSAIKQRVETSGSRSASTSAVTWGTSSRRSWSGETATYPPERLSEARSSSPRASRRGTRCSAARAEGRGRRAHRQVASKGRQGGSGGRLGSRGPQPSASSS
jgi:hypothetical protein